MKNWFLSLLAIIILLLPTASLAIWSDGELPTEPEHCDSLSQSLTFPWEIILVLVGLAAIDLLESRKKGNGWTE